MTGSESEIYITHFKLFVLKYLETVLPNNFLLFSSTINFVLTRVSVYSVRSKQGS